jgi:hypothetical protein
MRSTTITVLRKDANGDEIEFDVDVEYSIHGSHMRASMEGPEEWPEMEIESAIGPDGKDVELTAEEIEKVDELATQDEQDRRTDAMEAHYESLRDR